MINKQFIQNKKFIRENFVFTDRFFTLDGKKCEIIETEVYGPGTYDSRHVVKTPEGIKLFEHKKIIDLWFKERLF
jgi:hypothetical protein